MLTDYIMSRNFYLYYEVDKNIALTLPYCFRLSNNEIVL